MIKASGRSTNASDDRNSIRQDHFRLRPQHRWRHAATINQLNSYQYAASSDVAGLQDLGYVKDNPRT